MVVSIDRALHRSPLGRRCAILGALIVVTGLVCGCSGGASASSAVGGAKKTGSVPRGFVPTPTAALSSCLHVQLLAPSCPRLVPNAPYRNTGGSVRRYTFFAEGPRHGFPTLLNLDGERSPAHNRRNHPPNLVHVLLYAAQTSLMRFPHAFLAPWPKSQRFRAVRDGDLAKAKRSPVSFGSRVWNGRHGDLVLIPPYGLGGMQGNHLVFRWCDDGIDYALGLHSWEPFRKTALDLRAIIRSLHHPASEVTGCL